MGGLRRSSAMVVMAALMAAVVPTVGPATGAPTVAVEPAAVTAQLTSYPADGYEAAGDDNKAGARIITSSIAGFGETPYTEYHTLDTANGTAGDQDWFRFTVTSDDIISRRAFLIEAACNHNSTDPVIEVYGPGLSFTPSTTPVWGPDPAAIAYSDDGRFQAAGSGVSFLPWLLTGTAGDYFFRVRPYSTGGSYASAAGPYYMRIKRGGMERLSGSTRIQTAIAISREQNRTYPAASVGKAVVVANGYKYPDALTGALLAGMAEGPVLLTPKDSIPASVLSEIQRTGANRVYVLGGIGAISDDVVAAIQALPSPPAVYRIQGADRKETALEIAEQAESDDAGYGKTIERLIVVASAHSYADALAASPVAAHCIAPILLTETDELSTPVVEGIAHMSITDAVIVGGPLAVSASVEASLVALLGPTRVMRLAGDSRYETAKEIAAWAVDKKHTATPDTGLIGTPGAPGAMSALSYRYLGVASGQGFADALAGGAMCGRTRAPLLLTPENQVSDYIFEEHEFKLPPGDTDYFSDIGGDTIYMARLFGGTSAVSASAFMEMDQFIGFHGP